MAQDDKKGALKPRQDEDLLRNPGIGQSAGTFATGEDIESIEGENTVEGDIDNDTTAGDGVDPARVERANK